MQNSISGVPPQHIRELPVEVHVVEGAPTDSHEERRHAFIRAAGNCCYCLTLFLFIFLLLSMPDVAIVFLIVFMGLFFTALIMNQIRVRREAYLRTAAQARYNNRNNNNSSAYQHEAPTVRVGGFMYNEHNGEVVPIMVIPEGATAGDANEGSRDGRNAAPRTPGVAIYQAPPTHSAASGGGHKDSGEEVEVRYDGDAVYGRAQYLSGVPTGAAVSLKPDYEEVHEDDTKETAKKVTEMKKEASPSPSAGPSTPSSHAPSSSTQPQLPSASPLANDQGQGAPEDEENHVATTTVQRKEDEAAEQQKKGRT